MKKKIRTGLIRTWMLLCAIWAAFIIYQELTTPYPTGIAMIVLIMGVVLGGGILVIWILTEVIHWIIRGFRDR